MNKIEYSIDLNDNGRPCINLPVNYEQRQEDRFFAIELARYVLQDVYNRRSNEFDKEAEKTIDISIRLLGQVGDQIAEILWHQMVAMGEIDMLIKKPYNFRVNTIEERNNIGEYIMVNEKILKKQIGLRVFIIENEKVYELQDGITNENWVEIL